ncbi:MAG: hypothetical protein HOO91_00765 [Bacteroidales bacterium]|nr:hypothetical protein [Bacteroidales bacterium]
MYKNRIENTAKSIKVASNAVWDDKTKKVKIDFKNSMTNLDEIQKTITKIGHNNEKYKVGNESYASLPKYCNYRI